MSVQTLHAHEFEGALHDFHALLVKASAYYDVIFTRMLEGSLITEELQSKAYVAEIVEFHEKVHELQTQLSLDAGFEACAPLRELTKRIAFRADVMASGRACVERYEYITHRVKMMENYFKTKVDEYRDFFSSLQKQNVPDVYTDRGTYAQKKNDLHIISRRA